MKPAKNGKPEKSTSTCKSNSHTPLNPRSFYRKTFARPFLDHLNSKQQVFLDFVLSQYVQVGVQELAKEKLKDLLKLKYSPISNAVADLEPAAEIRKMFGGFLRYLY